MRTDAERTLEQLKAGRWEPTDDDGEPLMPVATPESKPPCLASVYALSKFDQERLCLMVGRAYNIPTVALRFFNVYGARQALSNPYTGVLAIFAARLLNDNAPHDLRGWPAAARFRQRVATSRRPAGLRSKCRPPRTRCSTSAAVSPIPCREIATRVARAVDKSYIAPEISGKYRVGDIRHCYADITRARNVLGFSPHVDLDDGLVDLAEWLSGQSADDRVEQASAELTARGLTV